MPSSTGNSGKRRTSEAPGETSTKAVAETVNGKVKPETFQHDRESFLEAFESEKHFRILLRLEIENCVGKCFIHRERCC